MKYGFTLLAALFLAACSADLPAPETAEPQAQVSIAAEEMEGLTDLQLYLLFKSRSKDLPPPKPYVPPSFSELAPIGLEKEAEDIAGIMASHDYPEVKKALNTLAISMTKRGVTASRLRAIEASGEDMFSFFDRSLIGPFSFADAMLTAESAVLGTIGDPVKGETISWRGPLAFSLNVEHQLSGKPSDKTIDLMNATNPHGTVLETGMECVFFPSQTLTNYRRTIKPNSLPEWVHENLPDSVIHVSQSPFCSDGSDLFSRTTQIGGTQTVTRVDVMAYVAKTDLPR